MATFREHIAQWWCSSDRRRRGKPPKHFAVLIDEHPLLCDNVSLDINRVGKCLAVASRQCLQGGRVRDLEPASELSQARIDIFGELVELPGSKQPLGLCRRYRFASLWRSLQSAAFGHTCPQAWHAMSAYSESAAKDVDGADISVGR
jgi:hypothetical protein